MSEDIRDKPYITHEDVVRLNFIKTDGPFVFRRHYRQGLRSHVMEILRPADLELEKAGTVCDGTRWFPKAKPYKVFRLFRTRLQTLEKALKEIDRVMLVEKYLAPDYLARSDEFIVDYVGPHGTDLMLCGFQEYVEGEILDPWNLLESKDFLSDLYDRLRKEIPAHPQAKEKWVRAVQHEAGLFIRNIKAMIAETGHIPDLAGVGNLMMVGSGQIKLVDINNISPVSFNATINIDDRGYPVCDKSIEALACLEQKILGCRIDTKDRIYQTFLDPARMVAVKILEKQFYRNLNNKQ